MTHTTPSEQSKTDRRSQAKAAQIDRLIGLVLLSGVIASVVLMVAGLGWGWVRHGHLGVHYDIPRTNLLQFVLTDIRFVVAGELRPRLLVSLSIAMLLLTPYMRVVVSLVFFAVVERNWKYSAITGFVLVVLTYSLLLR